MLQLALGVTAFDILASVLFALHAYIIVGAGDIPAISMVMRIKGHNAYSPCRMCKILGVQIPDSNVKVYYIPLDRSQHPAVILNPERIRCYDPLNLPLRTHAEFLEQAREVEACRTNAAAERLSKAYGIKGTPLLSCLSSIALPISFPYDFMHVIWENILKNLIDLWTDAFKDIDASADDYVLDQNVWKAIGKATAEACSTIPSAFGPRLGNIAEKSEHGQYTADMWSFWTTNLGPSLLARKFRKAQYFDHFVELVRLLNVCLQFEISAEDVDGLRIGLKNWVEKYEQCVTHHSLA